jgi:Iron/zinc purple acid phosphatase-like protein C
VPVCRRMTDIACALCQQGPSEYSATTPAAWSAFRESSFGHGLLDVSSSTKAVWSWVRNQDAVATMADSVRSPVKDQRSDMNAQCALDHMLHG